MLQVRLLEESNRELERARAEERRLMGALADKKAEREEIEERYSSLQEEASAKTRHLENARKAVDSLNTELGDVRAEHQREVEGLLEAVRELRKELLFNLFLVNNYIPSSCLDLIERFVVWNEDLGEWQLKAIAYTGNNMRASKQSPPSPFKVSSLFSSLMFNLLQLDGNQTMPLFDSYRDLSASSSSSRPSTRSTKRDRQAAKLKALLS